MRGFGHVDVLPSVREWLLGLKWIIPTDKDPPCYNVKIHMLKNPYVGATGLIMQPSRQMGRHVRQRVS